MRQFKTESKKLLDLMINSIYTNKEIFLRELISNASDAVDKLNFKSLQDPSVKIDQGDLAIRVSFDKDARTITISDNGIGMTAEELERSFKTGYAEDGEMTIVEFASRWLKRQTKYAPSTIAAYRRMR